MNAVQKQAWLMMICFIIGAIGFLTLLLLFGNLRAATAAFAFLGFAGFGPVFFHQREKPDERDRQINNKSVRLGFSLSYAAVFISCFLCQWYYDKWDLDKDAIPVYVLYDLMGICGIVFFVSWAMSILILYGSKIEAGQA